MKKHRIKTGAGEFIKTNREIADNMAKYLNLEKENISHTPHVSGEPPKDPKPLEIASAKAFRSGACTGLYVCSDRADIQFEANGLATKLKEPSEWDNKKLDKLTRYLMGTKDVGVWLERPSRNGYQADVVALKARADTDWAGVEQTRRSVAQMQVWADCFPMFSHVKKQAVEALSSGEAEFYGVSVITADSVLLRRLFE